MTEADKYRKAHEDFMRLRDILKFDRSVYSRADVRRFVKSIKKTGFYSHHNAKGEVVLIFKTIEQKKRLMEELRQNTLLWQKQSEKK